MKTIAVVVPCYNEESVLEETMRRLQAQLNALVEAGRIRADSRVYFVDDGSRDATWTLIGDFVARGAPAVGIKLSRNCGHQNALLAGLLSAQGDAVITIDADLQDDVAAIGAMVEQYARGADVVYGVRRRRDADAWFKRVSARAFYRLLALCGAQTVHDHADYRLLSRRAVEAVREYREVNLYLRGIVPLIGLPSAVVPYDRAARYAGTTKYPLRKMLGLAIEAITSFSPLPLRAISAFGLLISFGSFGATLWVISVRLLTDRSVPGWASTALPIYFLGGIQLLALGVIGEYVGKTYIETKARPRYIVEAVLAQDARER